MEKLQGYHLGYSQLSNNIYCGKVRIDGQGREYWDQRTRKTVPNSDFIQTFLDWYMGQEKDENGDMFVTINGKPEWKIKVSKIEEGEK